MEISTSSFMTWTSGRGVQPPTLAQISAALTSTERRTVLNQVTVIETPTEAPTLVSVRLDNQTAKFKWVQSRSFSSANWRAKARERRNR